MRSLRIIWALFRKNNSQPGFFATIWLLLPALIVPAIDFFHRVPAVAWLGSIGWLCFLGMSAGAGSFAIDTKHQSTKFLEYLPIRRWQIWLGNWCDGFLWLLGTILLASAYRTTHWTAPAANATGNIAELDEMLFRGRFSLMLTMMGFTFCAFSVSTFYRTITERDINAIVRGVLSSMIVIGLVVALPEFVAVWPGVDELAIPLLAIGAAYSLVSLLLFLTPIRNWHVFFRFLIRAWCATALYVFTLVVIYLFVVRWVKYEPAASDELVCRSLGADPNAIQVQSRRSCTHLFSVNLHSGQWQYVGRGMSDFKINLPEEARSLTFLTSTLTPAEEWLNESGLLHSSGYEKIHSGFPNEPPMTANGQPYVARGKVQALDAQTFVCEGARRQPEAASELCVCDANGRISIHVPMATNEDIVVRADGMALFYGPVAAPTSDSPDAAPTSGQLFRPIATLMNVRTGEQKKVELPGPLLDCAPDLSACVCLIYEVRNEVTYRRLVVLDLPSGKQRASIGEDQLPPVPYNAPTISGYSTYNRSFHHDFGAAYWEDLGIVADDNYRNLVWTAALNEPPGTVGLQLFDLHTGKNRTLLAPADLGYRKSLRSPIPHLLGLSLAGDAVFFETESGIHRASIDGSSCQIIAKHADNVSMVDWTFSPDRSRVIAEHARKDAGDDGTRDYTRLLELWENGTPTQLYAGQALTRASWLNDGEIAWMTRRQIVVYDVKTHTRRCAFLIDDLIHSPASNFAPRP